MVYRYILFNKPYNVLSQFTDNCNSCHLHHTLKEYISVDSVYPVGRLDQDSEGLLLLTNHGQLQYRLTDPKFAHPRTYWVQVERIPDTKALKQLQEGVRIKNAQTRPAKVKLLSN